MSFKSEEAKRDASALKSYALANWPTVNYMVYQEDKYTHVKNYGAPKVESDLSKGFDTTLKQEFQNKSFASMDELTSWLNSKTTAYAGVPWVDKVNTFTGGVKSRAGILGDMELDVDDVDHNWSQVFTGTHDRNVAAAASQQALDALRAQEHASETAPKVVVNRVNLADANTNDISDRHPSPAVPADTGGGPEFRFTEGPWIGQTQEEVDNFIKNHSGDPTKKDPIVDNAVAAATTIIDAPANTIMVANPPNTLRLVVGTGPDLGDTQLAGNGVAVFLITDEGTKLHVTGTMAQQLIAAGRWHDPTLVDQAVLDGTETSGTLASIDGGIAPLVVPVHAAGSVDTSNQNVAVPASAAVTSDDRITQVINTPGVGWNTKSKVILEIQSGNQDSNQNLINWFDSGKAASPEASALGATAEGKLNLLNTLPVAVASQVRDEILAGNPDSVGNLVDWFGKGNGASSASERQAWAGSVDTSNQNVAVPASAAVTSDDRITQVINTPGVGWNTKSKVILEIQSGNQDSNQNLINWFDSGKAASPAASSLGSTSQGKLNLISALPVGVKDQVIAEINAGNPDSVGNLVDWFGKGNQASSVQERQAWGGSAGGYGADTSGMPGGIPPMQGYADPR